MNTQRTSYPLNALDRAAKGTARQLRGCLRGALLASVLTSVFCAASVSALPGDIGDKFRVDDEDPMRSIPSAEERNEHPIEFAHFLQDLIARSESAFLDRDWPSAVKYYEAVAVAVPDRALPFSRLCTSYSKLGNLETAVTNCGLAITLPGAKVMDHLRFVTLTLEKPTLSGIDVSNVENSLQRLREHVRDNPQPPPPWDKQAVAQREAEAKARQQANRTTDPDDARERMLRNTLALQLKQQERAQSKAAPEADKPARPEVMVHIPTEIEVVSCKLAVRTNDGGRLTECMGALGAYKVGDKLLFPFAWSKALIEKDATGAAALLAQAPQFGVSERTLASMRREHEHVFWKARIVGLTKRWGLMFALLVACVAGAVLGAKRWRRGRRPGSTETATSHA